HFNDSGRRGVHGFETYYNSPYAHDLADRIQLKLTGVRHASNRGVRTANFRVIRKAVYPSVLVECGFLSNRADAGQIATSSYRETLAEKISEAVVEERYGGSDNRVARSGSADATGGAIPH
ncbi:MAG: N-acetylmuramoyl-L-alanine amidase, partial [Chthoniobacterales bacterium]